MLYSWFLYIFTIHNIRINNKKGTQSIYKLEKETINVREDSQTIGLKKELEAIAEQDKRTFANLVRKVLADFVILRKEEKD